MVLMTMICVASTVLNRRQGKWLDVDEALAKEWMASDLVESFLFYFARAKLAARDVAIHDILRRQMIHCDGGDGEKPMPPEVAGSAARRW